MKPLLVRPVQLALVVVVVVVGGAVLGGGAVDHVVDVLPGPLLDVGMAAEEEEAEEEHQLIVRAMGK